MVHQNDTPGKPLEDEQPLRLKWRRTWPERPADFVCEAPECSGPVGRIKGEHSTFLNEDRWAWFMHGYVPACDRWLSSHGFAETKGEAARIVERRWFAVLERTFPTCDA